MTPTLAEILQGNFLSLVTPPSPDMAGEFMTTRVGAIAMLNAFAAQDAARGSAPALAENRAIAALLAEQGQPVPPPPADDPAAIDAHNATLRRALIALHETAETGDDAALAARILALYRDMADGRRLTYPA